MKKWLLILLATGVLAGLALWLALGGVSGVETKNASSVGGWPRTAPSVVLMVLDTVRADHLSACGYARPTSPFTEQLFASAEFATCHA